MRETIELTLRIVVKGNWSIILYLIPKRQNVTLAIHMLDFNAAQDHTQGFIAGKGPLSRDGTFTLGVNAMSRSRHNGPNTSG